MGNQFIQGFKDGTDMIRDVGDAVFGGLKDVGTWVVTGKADWSNVTRDGQNLKADLDPAYLGNESLKPRYDAPLTSDQIAQQNMKNANDYGNAVNKGNMASVTSSVRNVAYSKQAGNANITPPSNLMKISDPATRIAVATTRGASRAVLNTGHNLMDHSTAGAFNGSGSSSGPSTSAPSASGPSTTSVPVVATPGNAPSGAETIAPKLS